MKKKIISKKTLIKEANIFFRIVGGSVFFLSAIGLVVITLTQSASKDIKSIILTLCVDAFFFLLFGVFIGLRIIIQSLAIVKFIYSDDFKVEIDEVIDKNCISNDNSYNIILRHNKASVSNREGKTLKKGAKCYVFNCSKKETIIKRTTMYDLDDELKLKLVNYHVNPENQFEKWEDE